MVKRETVRINAPGVAPKKETTTIGGATPLPSTSAPVPPPPSATRPLVPPPAPPPRPPAAPSLPGMGTARPPGPPMTQKPAVPSGAAPTSATYAEAQPVTIKAAPKKETARIQVSTTQKLPPQATVRLNQPGSGPAGGPAPALRTAAPSAATEPAAPDTIVMALSWAAVAFSLLAATLSYLAFSAVG